jgi:arginase
MPVEFIEVPYHMGRYDHEVGSGPLRIAATGIAAELGFQRARIDAGETSTVEAVNAAVEEEVSRVRVDGGFPFILAGNCNSSLGTVAAISTGAPAGIVWFDAHGDFNTPETSISGLLEGMSLAMVTARHVPEESVVLAGVRDLDPLEKIRVDNSRLTVVPSGRLDRTALPSGPVYVHLDLDVLDPAVSPGVNSQAPGGLSVVEVEEALRQVFGRTDVAALSIANYNPDRDGDSRTLHIICGLIRLICGFVSERGLRNGAHSR